MAKKNDKDQVKDIAITESLTKKLDSIAQDIKVYVNMNYGIAVSNPKKVYPRMEQKDIDELIGIRKSIKKLSKRLWKQVEIGTGTLA